MLILLLSSLQYTLYVNRQRVIIIFLMLYVACVLLRYVYAYNVYTYAYEYHDENQAVNLVLYNWMEWSMD